MTRRKKKKNETYFVIVRHVNNLERICTLYERVKLRSLTYTLMFIITHTFVVEEEIILTKSILTNNYCVETLLFYIKENLNKNDR